MRSSIYATTCVLLLSLQLLTTKANWWLLGVEEISQTGETAVCETLNDSLATSEELEFCKYNSESVGLIAAGSRKGIVQCQIQFANNRWNCTTFEGENLFGKFINDGTRETAFVNAMLAAGAGLQIARACSEEKLHNCTCKIDGTNGVVNGEFTTWKCSHDTEVSKMIVNKFLRDNEEIKPETSVLRRAEIHNHEVGLQAIQERELGCRCTGLSGSCTVQNCYMKGPDIEDVGTALQGKYDSAVGVKLDDERTKLIPTNQVVTLKDSDLVHKAQSPSFCLSDETKGVIGTEKRECDKDSSGTGSCAVLCCDRGYYTETTSTPVEKCQFVWCCRVECTITHTNQVSTHFCNAAPTTT